MELRDFLGLFAAIECAYPVEDAFLITILYEKSCIYLDISFGFIKFCAQTPAVFTCYIHIILRCFVLTRW